MSGRSGERNAERVRLAVILVILIAGALGSFWVMQAMRAAGDQQPAQRPRGKPDYYLENFNYVRMGPTGLPRYDVAGTKMVHYPTDDSFEITKPVVHNLDQNQAPMELYSDTARVTDDQTQIHMYGNANAIRAPYKGREQMHLVSEYLLLLPDDEIVKTDKPVAMTMGTTRLNGVGMVANNATQVVQLFGNVRGYYEPTPKKR
ncbi:MULTISPECIES: LPS export ABC transporter periplasmic protein LptC [Herbaspirillum]|jgi:lipopolysaccharide export system protein LptC|uniref:LPS export ABC transporter periplasmic protein LptC n=1 Tax=Herbaspirillum TaxID=963 RepID=UPI0025841691|nr:MULTISPECIES: LPS export ABC transporter periplasmic protein LptC [Herbaspirillum]MCP3656219.1 LPS export ABC transporter periplasmic protein LptC [Herbaspirillum sp.]MCP3947087.1 LPS export ABC transporter periplasmic protein LptC [Herbaspirillum sp.]MCP4030554.1 LPS export ABC transporter periplasmic protein LptC [Herbaspirillum sp.]MCP4554240.1 LPS export ABC transporter periplasmic protein LptC [Herbaspirillum sp.]MEE1638249.1 LPS export ABC transporter periplasmic protein LptC [Herbasp